MDHPNKCNYSHKYNINIVDIELGSLLFIWIGICLIVIEIHEIELLKDECFDIDLLLI